MIFRVSLSIIKQMEFDLQKGSRSFVNVKEEGVSQLVLTTMLSNCQQDGRQMYSVHLFPNPFIWRLLNRKKNAISFWIGWAFQNECKMSFLINDHKLLLFQNSRKLIVHFHNFRIYLWALWRWKGYQKCDAANLHLTTKVQM